MNVNSIANTGEDYARFTKAREINEKQFWTHENPAFAGQEGMR